MNIQVSKILLKLNSYNHDFDRYNKNISRRRRVYQVVLNKLTSLCFPDLLGIYKLIKFTPEQGIAAKAVVFTVTIADKELAPY